MWKGYYGKEPFDLRLAVLRLLYRLPLITGATLFGTFVFGGAYYVKNVLLREEGPYVATSVYRVEYAVDNVADIQKVYINEMSWNTYLQSEMFLGAVQGHLAGTGAEGIGAEALAGALKARVPSDLRVPFTTVTTDSPEKSVEIARAVEAAMTQELAEAVSEIASVSVIDPGSRAEELRPDVRARRAFLFSAVMSCFFTILILLLKETGDDSIWLPSSIWKRYGVRTAGTAESRELAENLRYFFSGGGSGEETSSSEISEEESSAAAVLERVAVCAVQKEVDAEAVLERLREICPDAVGGGWTAVPSPLRHPEVCRRLREAEGILLAVRAGSHAGRSFERVLEYLGQQDCPVTAAILWDADEKLIRCYDWSGGIGKGIRGGRR